MASDIQSNEANDANFTNEEIASRNLRRHSHFKPPQRLGAQDLEHYRETIERTSAHKRYYNPNGQRNGNRYHECTEIIAPLSEPGTDIRFTLWRGILGKRVINNLTDYMYWNDPSELISR